jgi:exodeoxyribonuclease VII large subunit
LRFKIGNSSGIRAGYPDGNGYFSGVVSYASGPSPTPPRVFTLKALQESIGLAIAAKTGGASFWIRAEIAQWNVHQSGHVYLELAEERAGVLEAKAQGVVWRNDYQRILAELGAEAPRVLRRGSEIQCRVEVSFHVVHGLKLVLREVDLAFNLGQQEKRKQETLAYLQRENLLRHNARFRLAPVLQRLAIVGAPDSAGLADLVRHLMHNPYGYRFALELWPVRVQGEGAAALLAEALQSIEPRAFDAVVMIRGGGSRLDLDVYNDRLLAETIARLPLPVLTGIGHETDRTVADEVAHTAQKTPTAVAAFILTHNAAFEADRQQAMERIRFLAVRRIKVLRGELETASEGFRLRAAGAGQRERALLQNSRQRLHSAMHHLMGMREQRLLAGRQRLHSAMQHLMGLQEQRLLASRQQLGSAAHHLMELRDQELLGVRQRMVQQSLSLVRRSEPARLQAQARQLQTQAGIQLRYAARMLAPPARIAGLARQELRSAALLLQQKQRFPALARLSLRAAANALDRAGDSLRLLSPDNVLAKGYAMLRFPNPERGSAEQALPGDPLQITLARTEITARIERVLPRKTQDRP